MQELWKMWEYPLIAIGSRSTLVQSSITRLGSIKGSNKTKMRTYAKMNYLKQN